MLDVQKLTAGYGSSVILHEIDFTVEAGEYCVVLGANGAGKTTLLRAISGLISLHGGQVRFQHVPVNGKATRDIVKAGLGHVPEGRQVFPELSVYENLACGAYRFSKRDAKKQIAQVQERLPILGTLSERAAGHLSGGEQQILAIGRALVGRPRMLMLDEPTLGLAPLAIAAVHEFLRDLNRKDGLTVLSVEQAARTALTVATQVVLIESGSIVLAGTSDVVLNQEEIVRAYIGI